MLVEPVAQVQQALKAVQAALVGLVLTDLCMKVPVEPAE